MSNSEDLGVRLGDGAVRLDIRVVALACLCVWLGLGACTPQTDGRDIPIALGGILNPDDPDLVTGSTVDPGPAVDPGPGVAGPAEPVPSGVAEGMVGGQSGGMSAPTTPPSSIPPTAELDPDDPSLAYFDMANPARNQVGAGGICSRLATLQCAGEAHCCQSPPMDFTQCQQALRFSCEREGLIDQIAADPRTGFSPQKAEAAFGQLEALAVACDPSVSRWVVSPEGLMAMFEGTLSVGANCRPPLASRDRAAAYLAACAGPQQNACLPRSALSWRCTERGGVGSDCLTDLNCQDGLYCPQDDYLNPEIGRSVCSARLADGAPCRAANECTSLVCIGGSCVEANSQTAFCIE